MLSPSEVEAVHDNGAHGGEAQDAGAAILHHVQDVPLHWEVAGYDLMVTKHVVILWIGAALLFFLFWAAARRVKDPAPRGLRNLLEILILFIRDDVVRKAIPASHADRYTPYLLSTFFFILTINLIGMFPGMAAATGNIAVTLTLAIFAFLAIQWGGVREYGLVGHIKNLVPHGLPIWVVVILFPIEFLTMFIRPFALCIRLFANMMAGHVVIPALVSLIFILGWVGVPISVGFTLFVMFLEILVSFLQAYIFTVLTANFIGMSVHPAH